jgi:hypothetical protein
VGKYPVFWRQLLFCPFLEASGQNGELGPCSCGAAANRRCQVRLKLPAKLPAQHSCTGPLLLSLLGEERRGGALHRPSAPRQGFRVCPVKSVMSQPLRGDAALKAAVEKREEAFTRVKAKIHAAGARQSLD